MKKYTHPKSSSLAYTSPAFPLCASVSLWLTSPSRLSTFSSQVPAFIIFTATSSSQVPAFTIFTPKIFSPRIQYHFVTAHSSQLPAKSKSNHLPPAPHQSPKKSSLQKNTFDWLAFGFWSFSSESIRANSWSSLRPHLRDFHASKPPHSALCILHFALTKPALYRGFLLCTAKPIFFQNALLRHSDSHHSELRTGLSSILQFEICTLHSPRVLFIPFDLPYIHAHDQSRYPFADSDCWSERRRTHQNPHPF